MLFEYFQNLERCQKREMNEREIMRPPHLWHFLFTYSKTSTLSVDSNC